jgi:hypothetical protein
MAGLSSQRGMTVRHCGGDEMFLLGIVGIVLLFVYPPLGIIALVILVIAMGVSASDPVMREKWPHGKG